MPGSEGMETNKGIKREFLKWKPEKINRWYGVAFDFKTAERESRLSFEAQIEYVSLLSDGSYHLRISRSEDVFIDHYEPDLVIDEIAAKCSRFIYPLNIQVSAEGIWTGKTIHGELISRWPDFRKKMEDEYAGGYIIHYLNKMEQNILDAKKFARAMQGDLFLSLFFNCTSSFFKQPETPDSHLFPAVPVMQPFSFKLAEEIMAFDDRIEVKVQGKLNPEYPAMMYSRVPQDAGLNISYGLTPETHFINSIWGSSYVEFGGERTEVKFTAFHLKDRGVEPEEKNSTGSFYFIK